MLGLGEEKSDKVTKTKILTRDLGTPGTDTDRGLVSRGQSSGPRTLPGLYQGPKREWCEDTSPCQSHSAYACGQLVDLAYP